MFSPYYASARRRGRPDPEHYCAVNVALYGRNGSHWAMTERGRRWVSRSQEQFRVGPSGMTAAGDQLVIDIDEITVPIPRRLRGCVRLTSGALTDTVYQLDTAGRHHWHPVAPLARVEVEFDRPGMTFSGHGYLDTNWGAEPLEAGFRFWTWSRGVISAGTEDERAAILYDCKRRDGSTSGLALMIDRTGVSTPFMPPPGADLPGGLWRMPRPTRSDHAARLVRTLEDAPFYTRSVIATTIGGEPVTSMHESLSLDRFTTPAVQWMLPFRMPRRA